MAKKRYITIQIIPDDASEAWTIKLRYRFFEFLFYATILALFAIALAAVKITEINGKVLTADHLATINQQLLEKQRKMTLLESELNKIAEQERKIREIVETLVEQSGDSTAKAKDRSRFEPGDLDKYLAGVRAIESKTRGATAPGDQVPDIWPVPGLVSQAFNSGGTAESRHEGMDIIAESNALVMSSARGIVIESSWDRDLGKFVRIDHAQGVQTVYGHLSRSFVQIGDHVSKGSSIGAVGSTGNSFGPHLHYEILVKGKSVDPQQYLK